MLQFHLHNIVQQLNTDVAANKLTNLVADTKNEENTGSTLEDHILDVLIQEFSLSPVERSLSQKKKIDKRATKGCSVYLGKCADGLIIHVFHFSKKSPDFLIVHPYMSVGIEAKSSFDNADAPTFNGGLNKGDEVRDTFYVFYKHHTNELVYRTGEQFLPKTASAALDAIHLEVESLLNKLVSEHQQQLGIYTPWYPRRTTFTSTTNLWSSIPTLQQEAVDWLCKV